MFPSHGRRRRIKHCRRFSTYRHLTRLFFARLQSPRGFRAIHSRRWQYCVAPLCLCPPPPSTLPWSHSFLRASIIPTQWSVPRQQGRSVDGGWRPDEANTMQGADATMVAAAFDLPAPRPGRVFLDLCRSECQLLRCPHASDELTGSPSLSLLSSKASPTCFASAH
jgi:hypothetical protein